MKCPTMIVPLNYPELAALVWNRNPARPISAPEALALYERNWRFVRQAQLVPDEAMLIKSLTDEHGRGHFLG